MQPLKRGVSVPPRKSQWLSAVMMSTGCSMETALKAYVDEFLRGETWLNSLYVVIKVEYPGTKNFPPHTHLSIRRQDRGHCRDWRDFQAIKNQLCGKEREGVEIYPAESRLVDTANQFHLWVLAEGFQIPLGYQFGKRVVSGSTEASAVGATQRDFEPGSF